MKCQVLYFLVCGKVEKLPFWVSMLLQLTAPNIAHYLISIRDHSPPQFLEFLLKFAVDFPLPFSIRTVNLLQKQQKIFQYIYKKIKEIKVRANTPTELKKLNISFL